jgi:hypothetical protein
MTELTPELFWAAFENLANTKDPEPLFRLYYDDSGVPLFYSMEDLPGNYIDLDPDTWHAGSFNLKIVDGKIETLIRPITTRLTMQDHGTACDHRDICVVVSLQQPHTKWSLV